jgi:large repetitive protein
VRRLVLRAGIAFGVVLLGGAGSASAATLEVTRTGDPAPGACTRSDCSLREAVRRGNASLGPDQIVLEAKTYRLGQAGDDDDALAGDLDVVAGSGRLTIVGKGPRRTAIDANDVDRILDVLPGGRLSVTGLALKDGNADVGGGGIENEGSTVARRVAVRSNSASGNGGGFFNQSTGELRVIRSVVAGNDAQGGAGLYTQNEGVVSIVRSKIHNNSASTAGGDGGGIYNQNESRMQISRSTIAGNRAHDDGGGIFNQNDARLVINRSTIAGNRTLDDQSGPAFARGGGIFNQNNAVLRITSSTISGNRSPTRGGGIFTQNDAVTTLTNTTVSGNRADEGGGLYGQNFVTVTLRFSTVARNEAATAGGGIFEATSVPDPMFNPLPPYVIPQGTVVALNAAPSSRNCFVTNPGHWDSLGSNLQNGARCPFDASSDRNNANPGLRRLARNGGPTKTHALRRTSDAVNAARRQGCPNRDQRGVKRPQDGRCDIGAFERKP